MDSHKATKNPTLNDIEKAIDEAIKLANQFTKN
jgi:hypothetical protein